MRPKRRLFQLGLGRPGSRQTVDWEIEHHLAEQIDILVGEGWDPEAAREEAERRFGSLPRHRRQLVSMERRRRIVRRGMEWREAVGSVFLHAVRRIVRSPGLTAAVVITLGLGIGVNTVMFGVIDRLLLKPPAHVEDAGQVRRILVHGTLFGTEERTTPALTYPDVEDLRSISEFASVGAVSSAQEQTLGRGPDAMRVNAARATFDFFSTLGVTPRLGRFFARDDDQIGAEATLVMSEEFWNRAFGGDVGILGRTLEVNGNPFTVIGVAPRGFTGMGLAPVDVWLPALPAEFFRRGDDGILTNRESYWLAAVVRMADGASSEVADSKATALHLGGRAEQIEEGRFNPETYVFTAPFIEARGPTASSTSRTALWLGGVSLIVLLIACANVANLLLAQASRRRQETAVRLSLGSSRPRLVGEMILGGFLLSSLGGLAALVLAHAGGKMVQTLLPDVLWSGTMITRRTVGITFLLTIAASLLAGMGPALQSTRPDLARELKEGGREGTHRRSRIRATLTVAQAAMSVVLLVGAGLFLKSLNEVRSLDLGLDADQLILAILETHGEGLDAADRNRLYRDAMDRVAGMPGVAGVAATDVPFQWYVRLNLRLPGVDSLPIPRGVGPLYYSVTPGYMEVLGLKLIRGRTLEETDKAGTPLVAVVNETMARAFWPESDALGECFYFNGGESCTRVVGVVENSSVGDIEGSQWLTYYLPIDQTGFGANGMYIRAEDDVDRVAASIAPTLRSLSPLVRYADIEPLHETLAPQSRSWTMGATLFSVLGLLALLVATVGLYSILAFDVLQRTKEIGIRTALGAERSRVLREVMADGGRIAVLGCILGLVVAFLAAPFIQPLLFNVQGRDPWVLFGVALVILAVASLSSLPPALRATHVDPVVALKEE